MPTKDDLIRENHELRARLALAERWMRREVQSALMHIQKEKYQKNTRKHFSNIFEQEGVDILTQKVLHIFGTLDGAPRFTLERLVDAEIYWHTLQQYPQMDGLPIIIAYQKILDAWIEERLVAPWRISFSPEKGRLRGVTQKGIPYRATGFPPTREGQKGDGLEQDIINLVEKQYTLSIGRFYQILQHIRDSGVSVISSEVIAESRDIAPTMRELLLFWRMNYPDVLGILISDVFFLPFESLMEREIFSRKRHESKVTYSDARFTRDILIDVTEKKGLFELIF